ncbi:hypothetical protein XaFJ1_GM003169 [Xanthomonas albilineans]|nr:hypothetical protein XaFJ1_GM003169 [Xanthomonas albilineans]
MAERTGTVGVSVIVDVSNMAKVVLKIQMQESI